MVVGTADGFQPNGRPALAVQAGLYILDQGVALAVGRLFEKPYHLRAAIRCWRC